MKIAINGFGRIGRAAFKIILDKYSPEEVEVCAINDLGPVDSLAYLLKYDTVYGNYDKEVSNTENSITVEGREYRVYAEKEPLNLPWKDLQVDVVIECTGVFTASADAQKHIDAGAGKVVLSAPAKDDGFKTNVLGSNSVSFENNLISNASCTTNCITPVIRVLDEKFGIEKAMMTTVHAYTATQSLVDGPVKKDVRRGRAAAMNIVPSTTGAAKATSQAYPAIKDKFDGVALRIPVVCGSLSDITAVLKQNVTKEEVNKAFMEAQDYDDLKGILKYTEEPLVSSDIIGSSYSSVVSGDLTQVVSGNMVKVMAWYDNEWGYSNRLVDMAVLAGKHN